MRNGGTRVAAAWCGGAAVLALAAGWSPAAAAAETTAIVAPSSATPAPPSPSAPGGALPVRPAGGGGCIIGLNCGCIRNITCPGARAHRPRDVKGQQPPTPRPPAPAPPNP